MTSSPHDPADCELAVCDRCDSYGDGYSAGKDAAYFAISTWELGAHASDCGCRPCLAIRQAVNKVLLAADEPVLIPDRHLEDCAGPRRGTWRDHEADVGGGVLELLAHVEGLTRPEALEWLRHRGLLDGPRTDAGRGASRFSGPGCSTRDTGRSQKTALRAFCAIGLRRVRLETGGSRSWGPDSRKSCSSMPSISRGLNGAPAGRFLDVSGWVGVSGRSRTQLRIRGIMGSVPTINTTLGACEGLDVVWLH